MQNLLGISLGTTKVGMAVFYNGRLADWRTKPFKDRWTDDKCRAIIENIERTLDRYTIGTIALRSPIDTHSTPNLIRLVKEIERIAQERDIVMLGLTLRDLKWRYSHKYKVPRDVFISLLVEKYPILTMYTKGGKKSLRYHAKLFEAIECAEYALDMGL